MRLHQHSAGVHRFQGFAAQLHSFLFSDVVDKTNDSRDAAALAVRTWNRDTDEVERSGDVFTDLKFWVLESAWHVVGEYATNYSGGRYRRHKSDLSVVSC